MPAEGLAGLDPRLEVEFRELGAPLRLSPAHFVAMQPPEFCSPVARPGGRHAGPAGAGAQGRCLPGLRPALGQALLAIPQ